MKQKKLFLLKCDDWEAIYVDGKCVSQGHSHDIKEWLDVLKSHLNINIPFESRWVTDAEDEDASATGRLPETL